MLSRRHFLSRLSLGFLSLSCANPLLANVSLTAASKGPVADWLGFLSTLDGVGERETLNRINGYINMSVAYRSDALNNGIKDYWASPAETLQRGSGDCEDYAILKYVSLLLCGMDRSRIRLVYGMRNDDYPLGDTRVAHLLTAVLTTESEPLLLCNTTDLVLSVPMRKDFQAEISFNRRGAWQGFTNARETDAALAIDKRLDAITQKIHAEGWLNRDHTPLFDLTSLRGTA